MFICLRFCNLCLCKGSPWRESEGSHQEQLERNNEIWTQNTWPVFPQSYPPGQASVLAAILIYKSKRGSWDPLQLSCLVRPRDWVLWTHLGSNPTTTPPRGKALGKWPPSWTYFPVSKMGQEWGFLRGHWIKSLASVWLEQVANNQQLPFSFQDWGEPRLKTSHIHSTFRKTFQNSEVDPGAMPTYSEHTLGALAG